MSRLDDIADALEAERYAHPAREFKPQTPDRAYLDLLAIAQADENATVVQPLREARRA